MTPVGEVRVLYADTDQMGVVNNVHYLRWFEVGRAEWIRAHGLTYRQIEAEGVMLPVVEARLRYRAPARYDDRIAIAAEPRELRAASVSFYYELVRVEDGVLLCDGHTRHACVALDGCVRRFPADLAAVLRAPGGPR
jgi:acyl-CoA thioester hydrolase